MSAFFQDDEYSKLIKSPLLTGCCDAEGNPCCDESGTGLRFYTILTECGGSFATHAILGSYQSGRNVYHTPSTDCYYCAGLTTNITGYTELPIAEIVLDGCTCRVTPPPPPLTVTLLTPCGGTSETHWVIGSYLGAYIEDTATNICYYGTNLSNTNMTIVGIEITAFTQNTCNCNVPPPPPQTYTLLSTCNSTTPVAYLIGTVASTTTTIEDTATSNCYAVLGTTTTLPVLTLISTFAENGCSCVTPPPPPTTYTLLAVCGSTVQSAFVLGYFTNTYIRDQVTGTCYYIVGYSTTPSGYYIVNNGPNRCSCQQLNPAPSGGSISPGSSPCNFTYQLVLFIRNVNTGQFLFTSILYSINSNSSLTLNINLSSLSSISLSPDEELWIFDQFVNNTSNQINILSLNQIFNSSNLVNVLYNLPYFIANYTADSFLRMGFPLATLPTPGSQFRYNITTDCKNLDITLQF
jgi:hypothetical protein